jgi:hypothetical protein
MKRRIEVDVRNRITGKMHTITAAVEADDALADIVRGVASLLELNMRSRCRSDPYTVIIQRVATERTVTVTPEAAAKMKRRSTLYGPPTREELKP